MATGAYDANGIWNYGEDDNIALFSDTLNLLAESTSDGFTSDRSRISTLESGSLSGLIPIAPTSATFVGGTGAVSSLGVVSFTTCTSFFINGVFDANYANYKIVMSVTAGSANAGMAGQYTVAGVQTATGYTNVSVDGVYGTPTPATNYSSTTSFTMNDWHTTSNVNTTVFVADILAPAQAARTKLAGMSTGTNSSGNLIVRTHQTVQTATTAFDGLRLISLTGTFTGTAQIFGYND